MCAFLTDARRRRSFVLAAVKRLRARGPAPPDRSSLKEGSGRCGRGSANGAVAVAAAARLRDLVQPEGASLGCGAGRDLTCGRGCACCWAMGASSSLLFRRETMGCCTLGCCRLMRSCGVPCCMPFSVPDVLELAAGARGASAAASEHVPCALVGSAHRAHAESQRRRAQAAYGARLLHGCGLCCAPWGRPKRRPWPPRARLLLQLRRRCPLAAPSACPPLSALLAARRRLPQPAPELRGSQLRAPAPPQQLRPAPLRHLPRLLQGRRLGQQRRDLGRLGGRLLRRELLNVSRGGLLHLLRALPGPDDQLLGCLRACQ